MDSISKYLLRTILPVAAFGMFAVTGAEAALISSGDVTADPATWTTSTRAYIGNTSDGSLIINGGSTVTPSTSYIAKTLGTKGDLTIDGTGSGWLSKNTIYIGDFGAATVKITNGGTLTSNQGYLGLNTGGSGNVIVDGVGSTWTCASTLYISRGTDSISITNGGKVSNTIAQIGYYGGNGTITVNGSGSTWINSGAMNIYSTGKVSITDGGSARSTVVSISSGASMTTDVGRGSSLIIGGGTGTLTNGGTIRMVAGAGAANGTYTPIAAGTWAGTGTIQALGGIWDSTNHTVTVSSAITGAAGSALTADLAATQRFLFTDGSTGKSVGAAFQSATSPTSLTLTADSINGTELSSLQSLVGAGKSVLSGWSFKADAGYTSGSPVYLSLFAGSDSNLSDLTIWKYSNGTWGQFSAADLAYDKTFASFTATDLSDYAVSGTATPTPIPAAAWLLGSGVLGLLGLKKRKHTN